MSCLWRIALGYVATSFIVASISCQSAPDDQEAPSGGFTFISVSETCHAASREFDVGPLTNVVVKAARNSQCPVQVSVGGNNMGSVPPGTVWIRPMNVPSGQTQRVRLTCGTDREKRCEYSYSASAARRGWQVYAEDTVQGTCKESHLTIDVGGGNGRLTVTVDPSSQCPVTVSGLVSLTLNPSDPPNVRSQAREFNVAAGGSGTITLSCGTDTSKRCVFSYRLEY